MEYGVPPVNLYSPNRLSGYFDAFVQNINAIEDPNTWNATLTSLRNQKRYLGDLLSKTVTTLNALRDRQSRNERLLTSNPGPRSKKKKILHNRLRTDKTIKRCENEEQVILDCLQVCRTNIHTLEAIVNPTDTSSTAADYGTTTTKSGPSYATPVTMEFDWNGWADTQDGFSPFHREARKVAFLDECVPDMDAVSEGTVFGNISTAPIPPPLSPRSQGRLSSVPPPPVPPNTACRTHSALSPMAACFEPSIGQYQYAEERGPDLDKLTISGLLASNGVRKTQKRRFSDAAINHTFHCLLWEAAKPSFMQKREMSWTPGSCPSEQVNEEEADDATKRQRNNSL
ncbi:hypothetical protein K469DRAFT_693478 [Zopfia rhizophila CBS 207.26]|uniref:Uncharacterized protein n=1 Tax=Zopfia rhizophila CBS 207.26 TaxID=1314779 RepID=A0A6A6DLX2_9PEZI|nr:hypothetical protein K469DRAFT_693478 [Zopfia rhizophila CBS 207.26]